jgi:hypothetical protein
VLYIWARENTDYKYQQGMNDILSTIVCGLAGELLFDELEDCYSEEQSREDVYQVFKAMHDPQHLFADLYNLFCKVMELGIKDMFFQGNSPDWNKLHQIDTSLSTSQT